MLKTMFLISFSNTQREIQANTIKISNNAIMETGA